MATSSGLTIVIKLGAGDLYLLMTRVLTQCTRNEFDCRRENPRANSFDLDIDCGNGGQATQRWSPGRPCIIWCRGRWTTKDECGRKTNIPATHTGMSLILQHQEAHILSMGNLLNKIYRLSLQLANVD
jgi:hypothetical protein